MIGGVDLAVALERTARDGFAHLDGALDDATCRALWRELEAGPMRRMAGEFSKGAVRMEIDGFDLEAPFDGFPALEELRVAFGERVREDGRGVRGLATWRPDQAGVAAYRPGSVGITAHLDGRWYRRLVAVFTVVGSGRFEIRASRDGEPLDVWDARTGSVTLMRAPGLGGVRDGRPFHAVHGPRRGVRCSVALRMAVDPPVR